MAKTSRQTIQAFDDYDSGVFLAWIEAIGETLMMGASATSKEASANLGGLIFALARAASELQERERATDKGRA